MTPGKNAVLCGNYSKECWRLNHRVHVELVRVGRAALIAVPKPVLVTQPQPSTTTEEPAIRHDTAADDETDMEPLDGADEVDRVEDTREPTIDAQ